MNPLLRASAAHVFVETVDAPLLGDGDRHHLLRVLRLREGATVTACDGRGTWVPCRLVGEHLEPEGAPVTAAPERPVRVAAAIPKGDRLDWMVQKLTEVGAAEICLLDCERSVVRWDGERARTGLDRLRRIAREAAMQSRRVHLPSIEGPSPLAEVASRPGAVLADPSGTADVGADVDWLLVGPEGGFSPSELARDVPVRSLGELVLRVETAAVVGAVLLRERRR